MGGRQRPPPAGGHGRRAALSLLVVTLWCAPHCVGGGRTPKTTGARGTSAAEGPGSGGRGRPSPGPAPPLLDTPRGSFPTRRLSRFACRQQNSPQSGMARPSSSHLIFEWLSHAGGRRFWDSTGLAPLSGALPCGQRAPGRAGTIREANKDEPGGRVVPAQSMLLNVRNGSAPPAPRPLSGSPAGRHRARVAPFTSQSRCWDGKR